MGVSGGCSSREHNERNSLSVCLCALRETARFVGTLFLIKHSTNIVILNQTVFFPKRNHTFSALATQNIVGKRGIHSTRCVCGQKLSDFQYKKITTEYDHMYGMCLLSEISMTMKCGSIKLGPSSTHKTL